MQNSLKMTQISFTVFTSGITYLNKLYINQFSLYNNGYDKLINKKNL